MKKSVKGYREDVDLNDIAETLYEWLSGNNYDKAVKYGERLEEDLDVFGIKNAAKISKWGIRKVSSPYLYRGVYVAKSALMKALKGKPLTLENRKYSSWSDSAAAVEEFMHHAPPPDPKTLAVVILRMSVASMSSNMYIVANVLKLLKYLKSEGIAVPEEKNEAAEAEREVIVGSRVTSPTLENVTIYKHW